MKLELERIRLKLLDLSNRNKLLNFRKTKSSVDIIDEQPNLVFSRLFIDEKAMVFKPLPEPEPGSEFSGDDNPAGVAQSARNDQTIAPSLELPLPTQKSQPIPERHNDKYLQTNLLVKPLESQLRRMFSDSKSVIEETGQNQLFLALGFLEWKESDDSEVPHCAPLILLPVELEKGKLASETKTYDYSIKYTGEDLAPNLTLAEKLRVEFGRALPDFEEEKVVVGANGDTILDPEKYFTVVDECIAGMKGWSVRRRMVLGFFTFSKLLMYLDLDSKNWTSDAKISDHPIIKQLIGGDGQSGRPIATGEDPGDIDQIIESSPMVLNIDSSQFSAIRETLKGKSIVIEGPPGTGKSQTITNLIACYLDQGKTVLFVSEKLAALEVVRRNLDKVHLGDFCLELHSHKAQKKKILMDIAKRKRRTFLMNHQIEKEASRLKVLREPLKKYSDLMNTNYGALGETRFDILWKAEFLRGGLSNSKTFEVENCERITKDELEERVRILEEYSRRLMNLKPTTRDLLNGFYAPDLLYQDEAEVARILSEEMKIANEMISIGRELLERMDCKLITGELNFEVVEKLNNLEVEKAPEESAFTLLKNIYLLGEEATKAAESLCDLVYNFSKNDSIFKATYLSNVNLSDKEFLAIESTLQEFREKGYFEINTGIVEKRLEVISGLKKAISEIPILVKPFEKFGVSMPTSLRGFSTLADLDNAIRERPQLLLYSTQCNQRLPTPESFDCFVEAFEKYKIIIQNRSRLENDFVLQDTPGLETLSQIRQSYRGNAGRVFSFLSGSYRENRKKLRTFKRASSKLKPLEIPDRLESLAQYFRDKEAFEGEKRFASVLGGFFKGLDTDWSKLEEAVSWIARIYKIVDSRTIVNEIVAISSEEYNFWITRENLVSKCEALESSFKELLRVNQKSVNDNILDEVIGKDFKTLIQWLNDLSELFERYISKIASRMNKENVDIETALYSTRAGAEKQKIARIIKASKMFGEVLGELYNGTATNVEVVLKAIEWYLNIEKLPSGIILGLITGDVKYKVNEAKVKAEAIAAARIKIEAGLGALGKFGEFDIEKFLGNSIKKAPFKTLCNRIADLKRGLGDLGNWAEFCRAQRNAELRGLKVIADETLAGNLKPSELTITYQFCVYDSVARKMIKESKFLSLYYRASLEDFRKKFQDLDRKVIDLTRERVACNASKAEIPQGNSRGAVGTWTENALLEREMNKAKRHIPVRQLLKRAGLAIRALKPCFMMSPMSVAQFISPGDYRFDVLIIDEASQVKPEEAYGAIARCKQAVIVGDPKQLPPTTFFDTSYDDFEGENESSIDGMESILEQFSGMGFNSRRLVWHYRSEHESLIAFSNTQWYDNELIIFPSSSGHGPDLGIKYHYINGATLCDRKNLKEAIVVARAVIDHAKKSPQLSLGVGTFNIQQKELIEDWIERIRKEDPIADSALIQLNKAHEGNEPLFVKNLENLQGDERDVVFISCTYGPDSEVGQVYQRFGPINGKYSGPRRLNVMFTRSKKRMEIFSSLKPEEITGPSEGAGILKRFLTYASTGNLIDEGAPSGKMPDSDFEISVARILENHGYKVVPQIGVSGYFIDLGVCHPDKEGVYLLGIECDGATYHSARCARDRDRLREEILLKRGWNIHRIWSTDWFVNKNVEVERLMKKLNGLRQADRHDVS